MGGEGVGEAGGGRKRWEMRQEVGGGVGGGAGGGRWEVWQ